MRRSYAFLPIALAGLAFALSAASDAGARDPARGKNDGAAQPASSKRTHKGSKRRAHRGDTLTATAHVPPSSTDATPVRQWGDFNVTEGTLPEPVAGAKCPSEMASVDGRFCIDKWEGSLVEVLVDGREVPWPPYGALDGSRQLRAVSAPNVFPQAYISAAQATRACAASSKRLCAPVEWRKACHGPEPTTFGYGNARVSGRCNDEGHSPMLQLYPQVAESWTFVGMTEMNDPRLNQLDGTLAPTGAHSGCTNAYGVYDMVGNLHEWTNDPSGTFQGGYYLDTHKNGDGCTYRTVAHEFTYHDYSTGFRCCADPVASE